MYKILCKFTFIFQLYHASWYFLLDIKIVTTPILLRTGTCKYIFLLDFQNLIAIVCFMKALFIPIKAIYKLKYEKTLRNRIIPYHVLLNWISNIISVYFYPIKNAKSFECYKFGSNIIKNKKINYSNTKPLFNYSNS